MALYYIAAFTAVRALPSAFDRARSAEKDFDVLRHTGGSGRPARPLRGRKPGRGAVLRRRRAGARRRDARRRRRARAPRLRRRAPRVARLVGRRDALGAEQTQGPFSVEEQIAHVADHIDGERALAEGQGRSLVVVVTVLAGAQHQEGEPRLFHSIARHWLRGAESTTRRPCGVRHALLGKQRGRSGLPKAATARDVAARARPHLFARVLLYITRYSSESREDAASSARPARRPAWTASTRT